MGIFKTKEDDVAKISTLVFITNFPESVSAKELFQSYKQYGHVVDTFIPNKRSKNGKRPTVSSSKNTKKGGEDTKGCSPKLQMTDHSKLNANIKVGHSYVGVMKGGQELVNGGVESTPTIMLGDECVRTGNVSKALLGRVKDYEESTKLFRDNISTNVWFSQVIEANNEFKTDGRIAWVEVEGIPFKLWIRNTFKRRSVMEDFKITHKGKTYWIRANETPGWVPDFEDEPNEEDQDEINSIDTVHNNQFSGSIGDENEGDEEKGGCNDNGDDVRSVDRKVNSDGFSGKHSNIKSKEDGNESKSLGHFKNSEIPRIGGSILGLLDEVVKVGQVMGYKMEGVISNMDEIIKSQGVEDVPPVSSSKNTKKGGEDTKGGSPKLQMTDHSKLNANTKVMLEFSSEESTKLFRDNVRTNVWFSQVIEANNEFETDGRIAWVEVKGILFKLWMRNTFKRIVAKWGELLDIDDQEETCFHSKRLCIYMKSGRSVVEDFKITHKRKTYWIRDENGGMRYRKQFLRMMEKGGCNDNGDAVRSVDMKVNNDAFSGKHSNIKSKEDGNASKSPGHFKNSEIPRTSGSILGLLDEVVKVGQVMGYKMEGAKKDRVKELCVKNKVNFLAIQETKMKNMDIVCVRQCCGNLGFEYVYSDAVGNSSGMWRLTGKKLLLIAVYAPHDIKDKQMLWDYLNQEIGKWKGKVVMMGGFNEVRYKSDKYGLVFNVHNADVFNSFISSLGLMEVTLGGMECIEYALLKNVKAQHKKELETVDAKIDEDAGMFQAIKLDASVNLSHMFYADDAVFVGHWKDSNITTLVHVLECFFRASGLKINIGKIKIMGVHMDNAKVSRAAVKLGCLVLKATFIYLGSIVGGNMNRLTLVKSMLGSMPIFHIAMFKVPTGFLSMLEMIRSYFFNGHDISSKKASWVCWKKVLAHKDIGGLGVLSLYALNRGMMFKWVWRFLNHDKSLWARVIKAIHGILDGPFILNEVLKWCKVKNKQALIFKVDFEKAYDSVRWDFLDDVLYKFRASGLKINMLKSKIMGVHVDNAKVSRAAVKLGCLVLKATFVYLGSIFGGNMNRLHAWNDIVDRIKRRLSKWKMTSLSIGVVLPKHRGLPITQSNASVF
nr:RNA-directed DNA polymerase, eukaryota, reverse transcriptase zinc-binding domain protein [Tanacetum cinerariifolium]